MDLNVASRPAIYLLNFIFYQMVSQTHSLSLETAALITDSCGRRPSLRIVGGRSVIPDTWPWLVTLRTSWGTAFCSGSLITDQHVLTAAHCLHPLRSKQSCNMVKVVPGIFERQNSDSLIMVDISDIFIHEKYASGGIFFNDIAIIKLAKRFHGVIPVCLPQPSVNALLPAKLPGDITQNGSSEYGIEELVVLGWGRLKEYGRPSETLQQAEILLLSDTLCQQAYKDEFNSVLMICGGRLEGGVDACQGDSGGPLLVEDGNGTWMQLGIVSFGFGCGSPIFPGVYTNVSNYLDWILSTISE